MFRLPSSIGFCLTHSPVKSLCLRNLSTSPWKASSTASSSQKKTVTDPPPPKEVREVQIPVPWGHISGKLWGSPDVQPVLGLHGLQDNAGTFDNLVPLLDVESFLAVDLVGHGRSSHYPVGQCYHYIDEVINIRRIAQHFKWDKITIVGHSIGSSYGYAYAGYFPDAVDKFVSIDCIRGAIRQGTLAQDIREALESNLRVEKRLGQPAPQYDYEEIVELYRKGTRNSVTRESCDVLFRRGLVRRGDKCTLSRDPRLKMFTLGFYNEQFLAAIASQITCEVLSIRAKGGFSAKGEAARILMETWAAVEKSAKRFEHHDVDGTHHVHLNTPENVAGIVNAFLAKEATAAAKLY